MQWLLLLLLRLLLHAAAAATTMDAAVADDDDGCFVACLIGKIFFQKLFCEKNNGNINNSRAPLNMIKHLVLFAIMDAYTLLL